MDSQSYAALRIWYQIPCPWSEWADLKKFFALLVHFTSCLNVELFYGFQRAPVTSNFYNHNSLTDLSVSIPIRQFLVTAAFLIPLNPNLLLYLHLKNLGCFSVPWIFSFYSGKLLLGVMVGKLADGALQLWFFRNYTIERGSFFQP